VLLSHDQNSYQNHDKKIANRLLENVAQFKYLERTVKNSVFDSEGMTGFW
jgi:hypothetical protein